MSTGASVGSSKCTDGYYPQDVFQTAQFWFNISFAYLPPIARRLHSNRAGWEGGGQHETLTARAAGLERESACRDNWPKRACGCGWRTETSNRNGFGRASTHCAGASVGRTRDFVVLAVGALGPCSLARRITADPTLDVTGYCSRCVVRGIRGAARTAIVGAFGTFAG
jgi:hypothetical protein